MELLHLDPPWLGKPFKTAHSSYLDMIERKKKAYPQLYGYYMGKGPGKQPRN